ncbi:uncharacterized protein LOC135337116 isoform X2 [Halichondria panicea]|uniref:uncharacterized protein LOC135337116 isoform X2 n=1 Tax=Halichondria panicea TaxID=6063 RepID=UPI00312B9575
MSKGLSLTSVDDASMYVTKTTALQVRSSFKHKMSKSWDITQQLLYNSTAYEPPPDILFVSPVHKTTISHENPRFFSGSHDIKIRIFPEHWPLQTLPPNPSKLDPTPPAQPPSIDLCVCAAMHLNQPFEFPPGYTIVSPVYFISCKTPQPCQVELTLPHAVAYTKDEDKKRLRILSTTTVNPNLRDVWSPSDRTLTELEMDSFEVDPYRVKFRTSLVHPSLYAVAVNDRDFSLEPHLPLRCSLYISYPVLEPTASVSGLYVTSYVGMKLKTVYTAVTNQTTENKSKFEEKHFTLLGDSVRVDAGLTNQSDEWVMTPCDSGEFTYNQLALTQETDKDSYSHTPAYPPHTTFFVELRGVAAAVRCRVKLLSGDGTEISYIQS